MNLLLHKNARTTPAIRSELAVSLDNAFVLSRRYGISVATVYKWKKARLRTRPFTHCTPTANDAKQSLRGYCCSLA